MVPIIETGPVIVIIVYYRFIDEWCQLPNYIQYRNKPERIYDFWPFKGKPIWGLPDFRLDTQKRPSNVIFAVD